MHLVPRVWVRALSSGGVQGWSHSARRPHSSGPAASPCFPFAGALARAADLHVGATAGALLHGPAGVAPPGMLGLGPIASHGATVSITTGVRELERGEGGPPGRG